MTKYVYDFSEGNKDMKDLLGGKGANLAEMTNMGLPVPHGFTITTEACLTYLAEDGHPAGLMDEVEQHVVVLESSMGKKLGDASDPLLVSVRSGAKFSMPGMMDTVLNLGLNEESMKGLAEQSGGDLRFARDAHRRFIQMFGKIVMDVPGDAFEHALDAAKDRKGGAPPTPISTPTTSSSSPASSSPSTTSTRARTSPSTLGSRCALRSKRSSRAGTASALVTTAARTRSRTTSARRSTCSRWCSATVATIPAPGWRSRATRRPVRRCLRRLPRQRPGEDVVAGIRNTLPLADLERVDPPRTRSCST